jgi:hypothetical protein
MKVKRLLLIVRKHYTARRSGGGRAILRTLIPDRIRLSKKADGSLWAHCAFQPAGLWPPVRVVG